MEELIRFVTLALTDRFTMTDLCEQFGISRKTGHKHLERYGSKGFKGLQPRSHRPHCCPQRTEEAIEALARYERGQTWGQTFNIAIRSDKNALWHIRPEGWMTRRSCRGALA